MEVAREAYPEDSELAKAFGIILYKRGSFEPAVTLLKDSAGKRPQDAGVMFYLGMAQYRSRHLAESKQSLQRALELNLTGERAVEARKVMAEIK